MRFRLSEITPTRIHNAVLRRIKDIPDALSWKVTTLANDNRRRLAGYHDIHCGQRCFIMANGPSLGAMDLRALAGEFTISMNRAYILYSQWGFTPSYYVCINELVLEQFADDISQLNMPRFVNFNRRHCFAGASNEPMYLRVGLGLADRFRGDISGTVSSGGTVTFACLQLAYFMGFTEVILIGLDHNFVEKGVPNTTEVRQQARDESHCHPDYFPQGIKWQLPDLYRSELAYALARQAFEADGRRIVDATHNGKCQVFDKVDLSRFFPTP